MKIKALLTLAAVASAALLSSCGNNSGGVPAFAAYQAYDLPAKLPSDPQNVRVKVSISKQRTYVMEGSRILLAMPVSVGAPRTPTPKGNYSILAKEEKHRANTEGHAYSGDTVKKTTLSSKPSGWSFAGMPMPYWCEFKPAFGFHTGWVKHHPCTDGCIRMHENLAPKFYRLVKVGTPVNISYSQPEDATYGNIPLPPDAGPLPDYEPSSMYVKGGYFSRHKTPSYN